MTPQDIEVVAAVAKARSGLILGSDKGYLVESRLGPVARKENLGSVAELAATLRLRRDSALDWAVADALANHETWFFRDRPVFETLGGELLPALAAARPGGVVRVWSAGCSTGQEPYSIAMMLEEAGPARPGARVELLATDVSRRLLEKAHAGAYTQFEVQRGLPIRRLIRHFTREEETWRLSPQVRQAVRFKQANLLEDTRPLGRFDVILCRNVLTGFDAATRAGVLARLCDQLADDGVLLLGAEETAAGAEGFRTVAGRRGLLVKAPLRRAA